MILFLMSEEQLKKEWSEVAMYPDLLHFYKLFKSYNPNLPMGQGMAAEFIMRRSAIEHKLKEIEK